MTALPLTPGGLRCAHQADPLGVAPDRVRLSWALEGAGSDRGPRSQRAYQLQVTDGAGALVSDTGRVESGCSADIAYAGPPLTAGGRYCWKVRAWDENGRASDWSDPARFEVESDRTSGWDASWIGPSLFYGFDAKQAGAHSATARRWSPTRDRRSGTAGPGHPGDRAAQHRHKRPRPAYRRLRPEPDRLAADQGRRAVGGACPEPAR